MIAHNRLKDPYDIVKAKKRIGKLEILDFDHYDPKSRKYFYKCRCHCDDEFGIYNDIIVRRDHLFDREIPSCGCAQFDYMKTDILYDPQTDSPKFGKLKVIKYLGRVRDEITKEPDTLYLCRCQCNEFETNDIQVTRGQLQRGKRSCGCDYNDLSNIPEGFVQCYHHMIARCEDVNSSHYKYYGERGIKVCQNWKLFRNFVSDMLPSYLEFINNPNNKNKKPTIERMNVNGDYCKENCIWIPLEQQAWNKTTTNYYRLPNDSNNYTIQELANSFGDPNLDLHSVRQKLNKTKKYCKDGVIFNLDAFINNDYRQSKLDNGITFPIKFIADNTKYLNMKLPTTFEMKPYKKE